MPALFPSRAAALTVALALLLGAGCTDRSGGASSGEPLLVMAASSLDATMPELIERFSTLSGAEVDLVLGATGSLAAQIENGAPADLFFSADEAAVQRLAERGLLRAGTVLPYAAGRLVLVWRDGAAPPASLGAVAGREYGTVAIANPEHAPYGAAAREALQRLGVWDAVRPRIVQGENVAQTYQLVRTGNADAGLVALSVVEPAATPFLLVDGSLHAPIRQSAAVLERSVHPAAGRFLEFVLSGEGQRILAAHGFGPAGG